MIIYHPADREFAEKVKRELPKKYSSRIDLDVQVDLYEDNIDSKGWFCTRSKELLADLIPKYSLFVVIRSSEFVDDNNELKLCKTLEDISVEERHHVLSRMFVLDHETEREIYYCTHCSQNDQRYGPLKMVVNHDDDDSCHIDNNSWCLLGFLQRVESVNSKITADTINTAVQN